MIESLTHVEYWHWWALAGGLLILEIFAPGAIFIWIGFGAAITGLMLLVWPSAPGGLQVFVFALLSLSTMLGWRYYRVAHPENSAYPFLNQRGSKFVGQTFVLETPIVNGRGSIRAEDTTWRAYGPNLPAGSSVRVIGVDGAVLMVEGIEEPSSAAA